MLEVNISNKPLERYRKPFIYDQERDRLLLFLDKLYNTNEEVCDKMSSFFIRRSIYFVYFGRLFGDTAISITRVYAPDLRVA
jgi:hypothetical protein